MGAQTNVTDEIVFPDGTALEISEDEGSTYHNMGVLGAGVTATHNYDKIDVETGNAGKLKARVKNQTVALAPSALMNFKPENWEKFSGGLYAFSTVAGTPVVGASQTVLSGNWSFDKGIFFENQNNDGSIISVTSVTGSVDGAGAADDFDIAIVPGGSVLIPRDGTIFITEVQDLVIIYDYTPGVSQKITAGTSVATLERFWARLRHYTDSALTTFDVELIVYGVDMDAGIQFNFKGANEDGVDEVTVAFTANVDTTQTDAAQLFELTVKDVAYNR